MRQIAAQSGHSVRTIRRIIKYWLEHPPAQQVQLAAHRHLLLDGTYIDGRKGIFAVMEAKHYAIIYGASEMAEGPSYLNPFCAQLKEQGLSVQRYGRWHLQYTDLAESVAWNFDHAVW